MKSQVFSIRQMIEAAGFCILTAAIISCVLFYYHEPVVSKDPAEERYTCLPGIRSDELSLISFRQEKKLMAIPVLEARAAAFETETALLSRGERNFSDLVQGLASWYGGADGLDGSPTASGEIFNAAAYTAAHRTLTFGTLVRVTYLQTGRSVIVRINDRGPFIAGRIIDLSRAAAAEIGLLPHGVGMVQLEILQ
jgi:rare lipoprotein A (peptidoglycan hydrolase)